MSKILSVAEYCYLYWNNPLVIPRPPMLPLIQIEPTNRCNLKCIMCPSLISRYPRGFMDKHLFFKIADQLNDSCAIKFFFLGEPLLHRDIVEMLAYAYSKRLTYTLETNAQLLSEEASRKIIPVLNYIMVSINGVDCETYEKVRCGGSFNRLVENLERFVKLRDELNPKMLIGITCIAPKGETREEHYRKFVDFWRYLTPHISIAPYTEYNGVSWIDSEAKIVSSIVKGERKKPCQYGLQGLIVRWNGKVTFCCGDINGEVIVGDASKDSIQNIWNSEKLLKTHSDIREAKYDDLTVCKKCGAFGREQQPI